MDRALVRTQTALRRDRRRRDERPRASSRTRSARASPAPTARPARPTAARCAPPAIEPAVGHAAANVPAGAEVVVLDRDPARQPRARRPARARAAPRRPARRAHAAAADDRRHRHARQDDDVEHARARAARLRDGPELPRRRRGPLDRRQRRLGRRGSGSSSRPTSPTARCSSSRPTIAVLTNAELDHHTTYASQRDVDDTFRAFLALADAPRSCGTGRTLLALAPAARRVVPFDAAPELTAGGSRFDARRRRRSSSPSPAPTTPATPPRR